MALWLPAAPLVLASQSVTRRALIEAAAIPVEIRAADLDERATEREAGIDDPVAVAAHLAAVKARKVAASMPGRLVVGADQTLALDGRRFSKPAGRAAAAAQLMALAGRTHQLHSAVAVSRDDTLLFEAVDTAKLTMRAFSARFLEAYLEAAGPAVTESVGGYQLEGVGIQLFERIEGDHFTILGLPLLPLLDYLRREGSLAA